MMKSLTVISLVTGMLAHADAASLIVDSFTERGVDFEYRNGTVSYIVDLETPFGSHRTVTRRSTNTDTSAG